MKSSKLRELIAKATPGPWRGFPYISSSSKKESRGKMEIEAPVATVLLVSERATENRANADLITHLANNAEAIAELIEAAEELAKGMNQFSHGRSKEEDKLLAALAKIKEQP